MDIGNALRRAGRDDITIRSIIANTIRDEYTHEVSIRSVKIHGNKIIVATWNPLINSELSLLSWKIKENIYKKSATLWLKIWANINLRFI